MTNNEYEFNTQDFDINNYLNTSGVISNSSNSSIYSNNITAVSGNVYYDTSASISAGSYLLDSNNNIYYYDNTNSYPIWTSTPNNNVYYNVQTNKQILDNMDIKDIEKYLRDKKLENINKKCSK